MTEKIAYQDRVDAWFKLNAAPDLPFVPEARMLWIDAETTGLDPAKGMLLEVSAFVTDEHGFVKESFNSLVIDSHYVPSTGDILRNTPTRNTVDDFVRDMHDASGLWEELDSYAQAGRRDQWSVGECEEGLIDFITENFGTSKPPLCGSSVGFDRKWLDYFTPDVTELLHYRNIDISTLKELVPLVHPDIEVGLHNVWTAQKAHRGTPDLIDTIEEYRYYLTDFLWTKENALGIGHMPFEVGQA